MMYFPFTFKWSSYLSLIVWPKVCRGLVRTRCQLSSPGFFFRGGMYHIYKHKLLKGVISDFLRVASCSHATNLFLEFVFCKGAALTLFLVAFMATLRQIFLMATVDLWCFPPKRRVHFSSKPRKSTEVSVLVPNWSASIKYCLISRCFMKREQWHCRLMRSVRMVQRAVMWFDLVNWWFSLNEAF